MVLSTAVVRHFSTDHMRAHYLARPGNELTGKQTVMRLQPPQLNALTVTALSAAPADWSLEWCTELVNFSPPVRIKMR